MTTHNPAQIDLSPLQDDPRFRAAYLYYLQLANSYIAQIFFDSLKGSDRASRLYEWLNANQYKNWDKAKISTPLLHAILSSDCDLSFFPRLRGKCRSVAEAMGGHTIVLHHTRVVPPIPPAGYFPRRRGKENTQAPSLTICQNLRV